MAVPTPWLSQLVDDVTPHVTSWDGGVPLQCHVFCNEENNDEWEVTLFGEPQSFGGRLSALSYDARLSVEVLQVACLFENIESCTWQTSSIDASDELGPHVAICGVYEGHRVWLRILGRAPERLRNPTAKSMNHLAD